MPKNRIGFTQFRSNLPGGRHANEITMRAMVVNADGTNAREVAAGLVNEPNSWTQFAGWSPDGKLAIVTRGWEDPANAQWEEEHKQFRHTTGGWKLDVFLVGIDTDKADNLTAVDRVSDYNHGLFFWPSDPSKLGFTALIGGQGHPIRMDRDGRNKVDLTKGSKEFTYGFNASKDGKKVAYHKNYRIFIADADGANAKLIETGNPFNFTPKWSPDDKFLLFVSGEHYNCHPHIVAADGTGLKKLADRNGYPGFIAFLDVFDYHNGSSDIPEWSADGASIFYTKKMDDRVELFQVSLDGTSRQLTASKPGTLYYHPTPSADGQWLLIGAKKDGARNLYIRNLKSDAEAAITNLTRGQGAMWPHWQPRALPRQSR